MYCNKCGSEISNGNDFCTNCGASKVKQEMGYPSPQVYSGIPMPQHDFFGNFGGLIISGALIIVLMIIGTAVSSVFINIININNIFRQILITLPIGFTAALTVRTKGLDLSFPAMISLSSVILMNTDSLAAGILLSLIACILIGSINAAAIHFLKLPVILVTLVTMLIVSFAVTQMAAGANYRPLEIASVWMTIAVFAAILIALALAFLTSAVVDSKKQFWASVFPVYTGSGVFAVLYTIALLARLRAAIFLALQINPIVFIGLFLAITRFHKNKALGIIFSVIPVVLYGLLGNILDIVYVSVYIQSIIFIIIIAVMIVTIGYRGRAALAGHSLDVSEKKKAWIALVPLLIYLLLQGGYMMSLAVVIGQVQFSLSGVVTRVVLLMITIGFAVWYKQPRPYGIHSSGYDNNDSRV